MNHFCFYVFSLLTLLANSPAFATDYVLEPVHTQILFFADHLGFSKSQGEFLKFDGQLSFDPENPTATSVAVSIDASSIDMDHEKWNDHMRNPDFLHVEKYPTIEFKSTRVEVISNKQAKLHGDLTMIGQTHPVVLDVVYNKSGVHPFSGKFISGFSATTQVKRSLYGMNYGLPAVGDDIEIRLEVEGERISK